MPPGGPCVPGYKLASHWPGAFQGEVSVRANTSIRSWTVRFTLPAGQRIGQYWNATVVQTGTEVTATPVTWNAALAAGQSATWGFIADGAAAPALSGLACTAS